MELNVKGAHWSLE